MEQQTQNEDAKLLELAKKHKEELLRLEKSAEINEVENNLKKITASIERYTKKLAEAKELKKLLREELKELLGK